ncbi:FAD-dependent monooxygenase [Streptomyces antarcticus]|uniref:FAD-dependent monooxygenase n=1 Tax=Streptomyces antarcticus TaxID=2996458 RepID=UPI00227055E8|nr:MULTISPECIES: FAD-dependent monooxygenase [unclassified Streptomyces]MCY0941098.1 FAD-dependent monooxygenase [Streptomyces sp. H34-AA3]MCZ4084175.1 FAD-dependent monooxygenase [Streptomyces sp. H34-S5]
MARTYTTDVLVAGAGPVGLTAAGELRRHGVGCRIADRLPARLPFAKAVGIQPRTLEVWDRMGLVRDALDASVPMRGQLVYDNGAERVRIELVMPPEVPYGFAALPQYETERILEAFLGRFGTRIERSVELVSFTQDADGVTSVLRAADGTEEEVRSRYLIGCDGAHSIVRKGLGLTFEGGAFADGYMLADVEVDWDLPAGYGVRAMHRGADGAVDDVLVGIPLPGRGRYRMSMLVPPELSDAGRAPGGDRTSRTAGDGVAHGLESGRAPALPDIQAVLDRLSPRPVTASNMRWASVFRISHRIVDRYGDGRVFVAGDAAHIHPPTGAQGMNTGIQDAFNLAWKLALAVGGAARPGLLASYDAERRPVGEEVVGRTVRHAAEGVQADPEDPVTLLLREAQLLVTYRGSPIVDPPGDGSDGDAGDGSGADAGSGADGDAGAGAGAGSAGAGPRPGDRAPDCGGLTGPIAAYPQRLYDLLRERGHVLLLFGTGGPDGAAGFDALARTARARTGDRIEICAVLAADAPADGTTLPVHHDTAGEFARLYGVDHPTAFVVRPDGYLGARLCPPEPHRLASHLEAVFAPNGQDSASLSDLAGPAGP